MTFFKIFPLVLLLALLVRVSEAQNGNFFIDNLVPPGEKIDPLSLGMVQDEFGIIYFTNKNGILEFDGNDWRLISTPGAVYTIATSGKEIFAGGAFGFGKLTITTGKPPEFELIFKKPDIFSSLAFDEKIFFCNDSELLSYSLHSHKIEKVILLTGDENIFSGLHIIGGNLYALIAETGLRKIQNGSLLVPEFALPPGQTFLFSLPIGNGKETLLGTEEGKIFNYQSSAMISPVELSDGAYLERNVLVNASLVNEDILALGTLKGGVLFVNPKTGATHEIIDYYNGLPDNEVMNLFTDRNQGVWVSHEYGFSRIAPFIPFRSYNHYPGLSGNLLCVKEIDGRLFAGTTLGLYYLKTEDKFDEVIEIVPSRVNDKAQVKNDNTVETIAPIEREKSRRKLFDFLRSKKSKNREAVMDTAKIGTTTSPNLQVQSNPNPQPVVQRVKRILKSRQYIYQKVEGIEGKVTQLLDVNGKTIVAGLGGAFLLEGLKMAPIFQEPVRFVFHSPALGQLFISTYDDRTISLVPGKNKWKETHYLDTLRDYISYIFEDHLQNIWFCGRSQIYKMELVDGAITALESLPIENPLFDETVGIALGHDVFVAASGGFKRYDYEKGFVLYDSLPGPKKYFASAGYFWFFDGHQWRSIDKKMQSLKLEWLGLFPNLRYMAPLKDGSGLWLVTSNNQLYKFTNPQIEKEAAYFPLFLRDVQGDQIKLMKEKNLRINQSENVVLFEFTQPNYTGFRATEFRYRVNGLTRDWSSWSNINNVISFSFLPPGDYQLAVQARDIFGKVSNVEMVTFEVLPYYWKRWWFYALEFVFFTVLVTFSIKLGRTNKRYRIVSRVFSLLSVILLIQFLETGIDSIIDYKSSPVLEFFIQLCVALLVFPVEGQLQRLIRYVTKGKLKIIPSKLGK